MRTITLPRETWRAVIAALRTKGQPYTLEHADHVERSLERHKPDGDRIADFVPRAGASTGPGRATMAYRRASATQATTSFQSSMEVPARAWSHAHKAFHISRF